MTVAENNQKDTITDRVGNIESTSLDRLVQVIEISFIFLVVYSLITLFDAAIAKFELYEPISGDYIGREGVGSLDGGQWEAIVRVTIVFNLLLFSLSLLFGIWIRKTRDGWNLKDLGFTFRTPNYSFKTLVERGLILGFLVISIQYTLMTLAFWYDTGSFTEAITIHHAYQNNFSGELFTSKELQAEYYFGFIEMGIIWPLSAGFFFFAYAHNSLASKFPRGMANLLAALFYVYYLLVFFMIPGPGKLEQFADRDTWTVPLVTQMIVFLIMLYISFSAFAETKSVVLPLLLNFVLNVVVTIFRAGNSLLYDSYTPMMLIPYLFSLLIVLFYYFMKPKVYSTVKQGWNDLRSIKVPLVNAIGFSALFITLSFLIPSILEHILANPPTQQIILPLVASIIYVIIIVFAVIVLTYEPTQVYDVLLVSNDGRPIQSHLELFQSDDVLISGFFAALTTVSEEFTKDRSRLLSVKQGDQYIVIEEGVLTKIIALVDKDRVSLRKLISNVHKPFEVEHTKILQDWNGVVFSEASGLILEIQELLVRFSVDPQTKWIAVLSIIFAPIMIILLGLI
ncbi:MAG: hypothetical protein GPJ54_20515 [Candidatus Heimdallarchaeota archaeon]|nr:hypothetical protein [Candidatus Heimdallarchaeota archaeon]